MSNRVKHSIGIFLAIMCLIILAIFFINQKQSNAISTQSNQSSITTQEEIDIPEQSQETSSDSEESTSNNDSESAQSFLEKKSSNSNTSNQIVRLDVNPQVQRAWNTCAPTTVSMLLSYKGIEVSQETLALEMETDDTFGTHNVNAIRVLNRHLFGYDFPESNQAGYRLETVTNIESDKEIFKERLKQNIKDNYPLYYTIEVSKIEPSKNGEHNVLGIGYQLTDDGKDIAYVYYLDPSYISQDPVYGGLKKITVEELLEAMSVCVEPNYAW